MFEWCSIGDHENCKREYERSYTDPRTNKNVWTGEWRYCECTKRGCKCYVPPAERGKKRKTKRKS